MKYSDLASIAAIWLCVVSIAVQNLHGQTDLRHEHQNNSVIVKFKNKLSKIPSVQGSGLALFGTNALDNLSRRYECRRIRQLLDPKPARNPEFHLDLGLGNIYLLEFQSDAGLPEIIEAYEGTGEFDYVEPNFIGHGAGVQAITPSDQYFDRQWSLNNDGSQFSGTADADIDMDDAWMIETGNSQIIAAILDSGLRLQHPEFAGRIWTNSGEIAGNGVDDDQNGYIDDVQGWDFAYDDNDPSDGYGHGTNVASILGATGNNSVGYAGIDWNCTLMILQILDNQNSGLYSWWTEAIYYAVNHGARVLNMSVGGSGFSQSMEDAVDYAAQNDVLICVSMMNNNNNSPYYPAAYDNSFAVGATDTDDGRCNPFFWGGGSSYGNHIDVSAPGNYIYGASYSSDTDYNSYWGGTSQASPHVAGLASLLFAQNMTRTVSDVTKIIEDTADDRVGDPSEDVAGWDMYFGHGRINALAALNVAVPVELVSFSAKVRSGDVFLSWSTATETNNYGFTIERLADDDWLAIGFIPGSGTSAQPNDYQFTDRSRDLPYGITGLRYRLKQVDNDGSFAYSSIVGVELPLPAVAQLEQNFPNPFNALTSIRYAVVNPGDVSVKLYDLGGREVGRLSEGFKEAGAYAARFDATGYASGVYFYTLFIDGESRDQKKMLLMK
jgi:subtilisin family serine protease